MLRSALCRGRLLAGSVASGLTRTVRGASDVAKTFKDHFAPGAARCVSARERQPLTPGVASFFLPNPFQLVLNLIRPPAAVADPPYPLTLIPWALQTPIVVKSAQGTWITDESGKKWVAVQGPCVYCFLLQRCRVG